MRSNKIDEALYGKKYGKVKCHSGLSFGGGVSESLPCAPMTLIESDFVGTLHNDGLGWLLSKLQNGTHSVSGLNNFKNWALQETLTYLSSKTTNLEVKTQVSQIVNELPNSPDEAVSKMGGVYDSYLNCLSRTINQPNLALSGFIPKDLTTEERIVMEFANSVYKNSQNTGKLTVVLGISCYLTRSQHKHPTNLKHE